MFGIYIEFKTCVSSPSFLNQRFSFSAAHWLLQDKALKGIAVTATLFNSPLFSCSTATTQDDHDDDDDDGDDEEEDFNRGTMYFC